MFCRGLRLLVFLQCILTTAQIPPLKAGDDIPESFWELPMEFINTPQQSGTLKADRNKLIILDFWATWCSACLLNFPKMEALQKEFGPQIKILAVTDQNRTVLNKFFASKNGQKYREISSVINNKSLSKIFPHLGIPFIIWIKDGKVVSTTDAEQVTSSSVAAVLKGDKNDLQTIVHLSSDRPLMLSEVFDQQKNVDMLNYAFMVKGYLPQVGAGQSLRTRADGKAYGAQYTNTTLKDLLYSVGYYIQMDLEGKSLFNKKRMIFELTDPSALSGKPDQDGVHDRRLVYSYDMIVPQDKAETLFPAMLENLSRYTPYNARMEKRNVECLILQKITGAVIPSTKGGMFKVHFSIKHSEFQNAPLSTLVNMLNGKTPFEVVMLDETGHQQNIDLKLNEIDTLERLNTELIPYGLHVVKDCRTIDVMVIRDNLNSAPAITP